LVLAFALVGLLLCGCGKKEPRKPTFPVSGQVFFQKKPAVGAQVILHPLEEADVSNWPTGYPRAEVGSDGTFQVYTYEEADGAPSGSYVVKIIWPEATRGQVEDAPSSDRLKGQYADPKKSPLPKVTVGQEPVTLKPFELN
jgi:hypothetical protein